MVYSYQEVMFSKLCQYFISEIRSPIVYQEVLLSKLCHYFIFPVQCVICKLQHTIVPLPLSKHKEKKGRFKLVSWKIIYSNLSVNRALFNLAEVSVQFKHYMALEFFFSQNKSTLKLLLCKVFFKNLFSHKRIQFDPSKIFQSNLVPNGLFVSKEGRGEILMKGWKGEGILIRPYAWMRGRKEEF